MFCGSDRGRNQLTRRQFAGGLAALLASGRSALALATPRQVSFGVFSLFEPREMTLSADGPLLVKAGESRFDLTPQDAQVSIRSEGEWLGISVGAQTFAAASLAATSPGGGPANLNLAVLPSRQHGGIRRGFHGSLYVGAAAGRLRPIVLMEMETAVASIVAAESSAHAPTACLMAQAIASRSFLVGARTAHIGFDFCDTTHCQFLRGPAAADSPASLAAGRTEGLCLCYEDRPFAAMYCRSCSGRTCSLGELGLPVRDDPCCDYPYYPVPCEYCLRHPEAWERELDSADQPRTERERIAFGRIHGWSAIPSNSFARDGRLLEGRGRGHGLGLCQRGAMAMARAGAGFDSILARYYPNTSIASAT